MVIPRQEITKKEEALEVQQMDLTLETQKSQPIEEPAEEPTDKSQDIKDEQPGDVSEEITETIEPVEQVAKPEDYEADTDEISLSGKAELDAEDLDMTVETAKTEVTQLQEYKPVQEDVEKAQHEADTLEPSDEKAPPEEDLKPELQELLETAESQAAVLPPSVDLTEESISEVYNDVEIAQKEPSPTKEESVTTKPKTSIEEVTETVEALGEVVGAKIKELDAVREPETEVKEPEAVETIVKEPETTEVEAKEPEVAEAENNELKTTDKKEPEVVETIVKEPEATKFEVKEPKLVEAEVKELKTTDIHIKEPETEGTVKEAEVVDAAVEEPEAIEIEAKEAEVAEAEVNVPATTEIDAKDQEVAKAPIEEPEMTEIKAEESEVKEPEVVEAESQESELIKTDDKEPEVVETKIKELKDVEAEVIEPQVFEPEDKELDTVEAEAKKSETTTAETEPEEHETVETKVKEPETETEIKEPKHTEMEAEEPEVVEPETIAIEVKEPEIEVKDVEEAGATVKEAESIMAEDKEPEVVEICEIQMVLEEERPVFEKPESPKSLEEFSDFEEDTEETAELLGSALVQVEFLPASVELTEPTVVQESEEEKVEPLEFNDEMSKPDEELMGKAQIAAAQLEPEKTLKYEEPMIVESSDLVELAQMQARLLPASVEEKQVTIEQDELSEPVAVETTVTEVQTTKTEPNTTEETVSEPKITETKIESELEVVADDIHEPEAKPANRIEDSKTFDYSQDKKPEILEGDIKESTVVEAEVEEQEISEIEIQEPDDKINEPPAIEAEVPEPKTESSEFEMKQLEVSEEIREVRKEMTVKAHLMRQPHVKSQDMDDAQKTEFTGRIVVDVGEREEAPTTTELEPEKETVRSEEIVLGEPEKPVDKKPQPETGKLHEVKVEEHETAEDEFAVEPEIQEIAAVVVKSKPDETAAVLEEKEPKTEIDGEEESREETGPVLPEEGIDQEETPNKERLAETEAISFQEVTSTEIKRTAHDVDITKQDITDDVSQVESTTEEIQMTRTMKTTTVISEATFDVLDITDEHVGQEVQPDVLEDVKPKEMTVEVTAKFLTTDKKPSEVRTEPAAAEEPSEVKTEEITAAEKLSEVITEPIRTEEMPSEVRIEPFATEESYKVRTEPPTAEEPSEVTTEPPTAEEPSKVTAEPLITEEKTSEVAKELIGTEQMPFTVTTEPLVGEEKASAEQPSMMDGQISEETVEKVSAVIQSSTEEITFTQIVTSEQPEPEEDDLSHYDVTQPEPEDVHLEQSILTEHARDVIEVVSGESDREEIHLEAQEAEARVEAQYEIDEKEPDEVEAKVAEPRRDPRDDIHVDHTISGKDLWETLQRRIQDFPQGALIYYLAYFLPKTA